MHTRNLGATALRCASLCWAKHNPIHSLERWRPGQGPAARWHSVFHPKTSMANPRWPHPTTAFPTFSTQRSVSRPKKVVMFPRWKFLASAQSDFPSAVPIFAKWRCPRVWNFALALAVVPAPALLEPDTNLGAPTPLLRHKYIWLWAQWSHGSAGGPHEKWSFSRP